MKDSEVQTLRDILSDLKKDCNLTRVIKLKDVYSKAKDTNLPLKTRVEYLMEALLLGSSYEEYLTARKIRFKRLKFRAETLQKTRQQDIFDDESFYKLRRADQKVKLENMNLDLSLLIENVKVYLEMIDDSLEYIRSACFNIKSVAASLREYISDD